MQRTIALAMWVALGCSVGKVEAVEVARLDAVVSESSGLVRSVDQPGVFWTHNDSGGKAELFAVSADGTLLKRVRVEGAAAVDWEDLASDGAGHLWIADTGNNANMRRDLTVYRVPEPSLAGADAVTVNQTVRVSFPDQTGFPDLKALNFDAEALFWADNTLWLASKHRSDMATTLYRFGALTGEIVLERVGHFEVGGDPKNYGGMVTGADIDASGRYLAVLTYHAVFVFERPEQGQDWFAKPVHTVALDQSVMQQCEGIAWDGWSLVITNEDRRVFRMADPFRIQRFPTPAQQVRKAGKPG